MHDRRRMRDRLDREIMLALPSLERRCRLGRGLNSGTVSGWLSSPGSTCRLLRGGSRFGPFLVRSALIDRTTFPRDVRHARRAAFRRPLDSGTGSPLRIEKALSLALVEIRSDIMG